jgi:hypothetical protein
MHRQRPSLHIGPFPKLSNVKAETEFKLADSEQASLLQLKELLWSLFAAYRPMPAVSNPGESRSASATGAAAELAPNSASEPNWANKRGGAVFVPDFYERKFIFLSLRTFLPTGLVILCLPAIQSDLLRCGISGQRLHPSQGRGSNDLGLQLRATDAARQRDNAPAHSPDVSR